MSTIKATTLSTQSNATVSIDTVVNGTAKAWVNFNGTGTVAIRRAFNVSSITDNATGDYTVNFTTAMPDANYSASINILENAARLFTVTSLITTSLRINCMNTAQTLGDNTAIGVSIFS
jgi:hypothetical protein